MSTLIVTLPTSLPLATTPCSTVLTEDGLTVSQHTQAPMALWPAATGGELVAVVPAAQLSWHRLELPKGTLERGPFQDGSPARLRSVLEGLLEDHLLDEPEQLHFALDPSARAGMPIWVAACNRAWLNAWLQTLEQAGRPVARIVPELAPAAADFAGSSTLHLIGTPDNAQLLWSDPGGVSLLPLSGATLTLLSADPDGTAAPSVAAEPAVAALAEQHFAGRVALQTAAQRALLAARSEWDLAQFELLRSRGARTRKRLSDWSQTLLRAPHWRPARWAALALVVVNLVGLQAWAWREQAALSAKRAAVRDILTTTFPDVRVVVDAPLQMERALANLQRQSGAASHADLEAMLGRFQAVAPEAGAPAAIEFVAGELRLQLPASALAQASPIATQLQAYGYAAQVRGDSLVLQPERRP